MIIKKSNLLFIILSFACTLHSCAQFPSKSGNSAAITTGAEQTNLYLPILKNKRIGLFANQTSVIGKTHLADSLISLGIKIEKIFGPEHGFRGKANAGEHVDDGIDTKTGIKVISLYGNHKKPTTDDLSNIDLLVFDIQDVGVRFYTFISSLQYFMEAALENNIPLVILDRPNPNGFYIDGPLLEKEYASFVGMQPVPIVYGMTIGEYALMLYGEKWLSKEANAKILNTSSKKESQIRVIPCKNYNHNSKYILPVNPSPNLKQMQSIYLYPSTCFFEGTVISEGRGTPTPFQVFGHPDLPKNLYEFTPAPNEGAKSSKCFFQKCYGWNLAGSNEAVLKLTDNKIQIKYLLEAYKLFPGKDSFFLANNFFNKLAGNNKLMQQIKNGASEAEIRNSWAPGINSFKAIRRKYLLYEDFKN
jgi:uncharacterized protein YbbC (DUF1343 family)